MKSARRQPGSAPDRGQDGFAVTIDRVAAVLERLREAVTALQQDGRLKPFYWRMLSDLKEVTGARYAALGLFDHTGRLEDFLTLGLSGRVRRDIGTRPEGKGVLGAFYQARGTVRIDDIAAHPDSCGFPAGHPPMRNLMGGPITVSGDVRGVIYLADRLSGGQFDAADETALQLFIAQIQHLLERNDLIAVMQEEHRMLEHQRAEQQALIRTLQETRDQLLQSQKMAAIGQLAGGVAHEINNPLAYVNTNIGVLREYVNDLLAVLDVCARTAPDAVRAAQLEALADEAELEHIRRDAGDLLDETREGMQRIRSVVDDLTDFTHAGQAEWRLMDVHAGLDGTLDLLRNGLGSETRFVREYGELPMLECVDTQISQVFRNLLVNAAHAVDGRGTVFIRTGCDGRREWVYVQVADTGRGIAQEHLTRVFEPFFTTRPVGEGTGLGLSLAYGIVQRHGGTIDVESRMSEGTAFTVRLPVRQTEPGIKYNMPGS